MFTGSAGRECPLAAATLLSATSKLDPEYAKERNRSNETHVFPVGGGLRDRGPLGLRHAPSTAQGRRLRACLRPL